MSDNKTQYHHGDVPSALMQAALLHIKNEGVEKLSLRALARDIGVSQTAPYRHFKDKNHLLVVLACKGFRQLACLKSQQPSPLAFIALIEAGMSYVYFAMEHPEQYKLMFGSKIKQRRDYPELMEAGGAAFQVISSYVVKGMEAGVFINKDPEVLARSCWTTVHGLASLGIDEYFEHIPGEFDDFLREQVSLCIRGFMKDPAQLDTLIKSKSQK